MIYCISSACREEGGMTMSVDDEILDTACEVLTGKIHRQQLAEMPVRPQLYAAVAIIFARRSTFLADDNVLTVPYLEVLDRLLVRGTPTARSADTFRTMSFREELHRKIKGKTHLTPPIELKMLVVTHGNNPAVEEFLADAAQGNREQWFERVQLRAAKDTSDSYWSTLVAKIEENGGVPALLAMRDVVQARLNALAEEAANENENVGM